MWTNEIHKGSDGNWLVRSHAMIDDTKNLKVTTTKGQGGEIRTAAYVFIREDDHETHRMFTDFAVVLIKNKARATESAVRRQHEEAMEKAGDIIAQAMDFYRSNVA
jgi:hypothetical protein